MLLLLSLGFLFLAHAYEPFAMKMLHRNATAKQNVCGGSNKAGSQNIICPISHGGFHLYCGVLPFQDAAATCESQGWRLAVLTDSNAINALATQEECSAMDTPAWIASFNGYAADPCMINSVNPGGAMAGLGVSCFDARWPVLCEEIPSLTTQSTVTASLVLSTGTTITTTTTTKSFPNTTTTTTTTSSSSSSTCSSKTTTTTSVCPQPSIQPIKNVHRAVRLPGQWILKQKEQEMQEKQQRQESYCPNCKNVCPFQRNGLRVIQGVVGFQNAAEECHKRGWRLADITTGAAAEAALLILQCAPPTFISEAGIAWIRSYDGVGGGNCMLGLSGLNRHESQFSPIWFYEGCDEIGEVQVLCQTNDDLDSGPAPTCDGGWVGSRRIVQLNPTTTTTYTRTTPLTTSTVTRTVCQCGQGGCDPDCWDSHWDHEFDHDSNHDFF